MVISQDPPIHNNTLKRNQCFYWNGIDSVDLFGKNIVDPKIKNYFESNDWGQEKSIIYSYNSHGYRCEEFNGTHGFLAIGCSFTEGVGLKVEQSWPYILSNMLDESVWNLGVSGASPDTCLRILEYYIRHLSVRGVFIQYPSKERLELKVIDKWLVSSPTSAENAAYKNWISAAENIEFNLIRNIFAIRYVCKNYNVPLVELHQEQALAMISDRARDINTVSKGHPGPSSNKNFAEYFYKQLVNL